MMRAPADVRVCVDVILFILLIKRIGVQTIHVSPCFHIRGNLLQYSTDIPISTISLIHPCHFGTRLPLRSKGYD